MPMRRLALIAAVATLVVAGCAREREPAPTPPREAPRRPPPAPAPSAADYVSRAGSIDLFVIRSSELALARSQDLRLKEFAREMLRAHNGTGGQLSLAGRRLNLLPSVTLRPEHQAMMRELLQSPGFDQLYWRQQMTVHEEATDLHGRYSARGGSPTLKPVATAALAIERSHLARLKAIR